MNTTTALLHQIEVYNPTFYVHNIFFVITFALFTNMLRKIHSFNAKLNNIDCKYVSLEYLTSMLNKKNMLQEHDIDVMKDSNKELKSDLRKLQKYYEQLLVKFSDLQRECKELQNALYDDMKTSEDRQKDARDCIAQDLDFCKGQINYLETSLQSLKNDFSVMHRDVMLTK